MRSLGAEEPAGLTRSIVIADSEQLRRAWLLGCALAEAIGIGFAAGLFSLVRGLAPDASHGLWLSVYIAAGAIEGTLLGALQARVLRRRVPGFNSGAFTAITALTAVALWAGAALARASAEAAGGATQAPAMGVVLGLSVLGGAAAGSLIGAAQALVLRRYVRHSLRYVVCSAGGWAAAMPLIFVGASVCALDWGLAAIVAVGALAGALAGTPLGSMTWMFVGKIELR